MTIDVSSEGRPVVSVSCDNFTIATDVPFAT
jgi:hypothetical protein